MHRKQLQGGHLASHRCKEGALDVVPPAQTVPERFYVVTAAAISTQWFCIGDWPAYVFHQLICAVTTVLLSAIFLTKAMVVAVATKWASYLPQQNLQS